RCGPKDPAQGRALQPLATPPLTAHPRGLSAMLSRSFFKAGHTPTLLSAFLYFDISFMTWVLLGPLGVAIAKSFGLTPAQKGLMVAVPVLAGAVLRLVAGVAGGHDGPKKAGVIGQLVVLPRLATARFLG